MKSVCVSVSELVSLSHKTGLTLYRSQSYTDLHQTCHQSRVQNMWLPIVFSGNLKYFYLPNGSVINPHHWSYGKISLMSNISKMTQWKSNRKPAMGHRLAPWPLTSDELEHSSRSLQLRVKYFDNGVWNATPLDRYTFHTCISCLQKTSAEIA